MIPEETAELLRIYCEEEDPSLAWPGRLGRILREVETRVRERLRTVRTVRLPFMGKEKRKTSLLRMPRWLGLGQSSTAWGKGPLSEEREKLI